MENIELEKAIELEKPKECKTCKKKKMKATDWVMFLFSLYILFATIYGTIHLFKNFF